VNNLEQPIVLCISSFFIWFLRKNPYVPNGFHTFRCANYRSKNLSFSKQLCFFAYFSFWPIMSLSTIFNDHWLLMLIVIHSINRYIICKIFINVDFILVPYYMIHDIIYWDLIIFNHFRYLGFFWNRTINYVKWIFLGFQPFRLGHFAY